MKIYNHTQVKTKSLFPHNLSDSIEKRNHCGRDPRILRSIAVERIHLIRNSEVWLLNLSWEVSSDR